jgi:hypothetical protein
MLSMKRKMETDGLSSFVQPMERQLSDSTVAEDDTGSIQEVVSIRRAVDDDVGSNYDSDDAVLLTEAIDNVVFEGSPKAFLRRRGKLFTDASNVDK